MGGRGQGTESEKHADWSARLGLGLTRCYSVHSSVIHPRLVTGTEAAEKGTCFVLLLSPGEIVWVLAFQGVLC